MLPVTVAHAASMVKLLNDRETFRYLDQEPPTLAYLERYYGLLETGLSPSGTEAWLTWICQLNSTDEPVGYIQATIRAAEEPKTSSIGYVFGADYRRRGYAREAVHAMLHVVFRDYGVERVQVEMDARNLASIALAESLGFHYVRTVIGAATVRGELVDEHEYVLSNDAYSR